MHKIIVTFGTRPEIVKMAPVVEELNRCPEVEVTIVHSGQHYDFEMSRIFIKELEVPEPDLELRIRPGSHAEQTAQMLVGYERIFKKVRPDLVLAEGDTNTVLATALTSLKLQIPFGHVEAGLRCYDLLMPEEINRTVADHCAQLCFAPTVRAALNLSREGIAPKRILITGNTIVDSCLKHYKISKRKSKILSTLGFTRDEPYIVATFHRAENVDNPERLGQIISALTRLKGCKIVCPVHPRTKIRLTKFGLWQKMRLEHIIVIPPLGYWDFLQLVANSKLVLTDSGGLQEEALTLRVPCLTLRHSTERPETIELGANVLVGTTADKIVSSATKILQDNDFARKMKPKFNPFGDGKAGKRIARICRRKCEQGIEIESPSYFDRGSAYFKLLPIDGKFIDLTVKDLMRMNPGFVITTVFDKHGNPLFPSPQLRVREGWSVELFGEPAHMESHAIQDAATDSSKR